MQILDDHVKRKEKYMQILIQNYNDNLHEHQNQTKYYHYSFNTIYMKPGKIDVDAKLHQTSKMN